MGRRIIEVELNNVNRICIYFDHYGLLLYNAFIINQSESLRLYKAMVSEYYYRLSNNLSAVSEIDENKAYLPLTELPLVIDFLDNQVLPYLNTMTQEIDLTELWNVGSNLDRFLTNQGGFFENFVVQN